MGVKRQRFASLAEHARHWVAPSELARYEGCDKRTILRMITDGSIAAYRCGRDWRIPLDAARVAFSPSVKRSA
jgi:excisionase family DNA binding protein